MWRKKGKGLTRRARLSEKQGEGKGGAHAGGMAGPRAGAGWGVERISLFFSIDFPIPFLFFQI